MPIGRTGSSRQDAASKSYYLSLVCGRTDTRFTCHSSRGSALPDAGGVTSAMPFVPVLSLLNRRGRERCAGLSR
jgi:hypothetical protein